VVKARGWCFFWLLQVAGHGPLHCLPADLVGGAPQIRALVVENTFCSVEHMAGQMLPFLGLLIGPGRPANFLVTNKWNNLKQISNIYHTPLLMLTSLQVPTAPMLRASCVWFVQRAACANRLRLGC
jgi:hypothetical protein